MKIPQDGDAVQIPEYARDALASHEAAMAYASASIEWQAVCATLLGHVGNLQADLDEALDAVH